MSESSLNIVSKISEDIWGSSSKSIHFTTASSIARANSLVAADFLFAHNSPIIGNLSADLPWLHSRSFKLKRKLMILKIDKTISL